jgi:hypothetical protein
MAMTEEPAPPEAWPGDVPWLPKILERTPMSLEKVIQKLTAEISNTESTSDPLTQSYPASQTVALEHQNSWLETPPQVQLWPPLNMGNEVATFRDINYNTMPPNDYSPQSLQTDFFSFNSSANPPNAANIQPEYRGTIPILGAGPSLQTNVTINPQQLSLQQDVSGPYCILLTVPK